MMKIINGLPVSKGIAIGHSHLLTKPSLRIASTQISAHQVSEELKNFEQILKEIVSDMDELIEKYTYTKDDKEILYTHKMIVQDPEFIKNIHFMIKEELLSLETAISKHFIEVTELFRNMNNNFYAQRAIDYEDVGIRFLNKLNGKNDEPSVIPVDSIIVASEIIPSQLTILFKQKISGICTEKGTFTSHSSIIARAFGIPAVVAVPSLLDLANNPVEIIIDGTSGKIIIEPDEETLKYYRGLYENELQEKKELKKIENLEAVTRDGKRIKLYNNIEIPDEIELISGLKNDGIGLFRTEFIYLDRRDLPSEEEQFVIYRRILEKMHPRPVTIRTIDMGGDKLSHVIYTAKEANPYLGCRGIRLALEQPHIFKTQLRAILRAAKFGTAKIMFPMISSVEELHKAKKHLKEAMLELEKENVDYCKEIEVGIMIEVPSAVIISDHLAQNCDFFSIGTNDLVQYTLAVDRNSEMVNKYYDSLHPAILRMIKIAADNAAKFNIPISICGEMASEPMYTQLLLGLGVNELSINPNALAVIKKKIIDTDLKTTEIRVDRLLELSCSRDIKTNLI
ncbi:MAG: phosphoenolpyruvate--protein phosphotransferase [Candidatus Cloacimonetes bacterium]|nr:phosphoenolpyruvate--protein phosphotransferase [Candidatus Cloacimonadota bacterium]